MGSNVSSYKAIKKAEEATDENPLSMPIIQSINKHTVSKDVNSDDIVIVEKSKKDEFLGTMKEVCKVLPDGKEQFEAIKSFTDGNMSYSEMRMRCG